MMPCPAIPRVTANMAVAHYCKFFIGKGPDYTQGFLDSYSDLGRVWASVSLDYKYAGAKEAAAHFKRPAPAIS